MIQTCNNAVLTIDLKALAENYQLMLSAIKVEAECAAVVKSDGYGLGATRVVKKLSSLGCSKFFVGCLEEAINLRTFSLTDEIYVLNGIEPKQEEAFYEHNLIPVLNFYEQAQLWINYAKRKQKRLASVLHIDTGINRLGMSIKEAKKLFDNKVASDLKIFYLMSHLANAEDADHVLNEIQFQKTQEFAKFAGNIPISLCNSGGIFLGPKYHFDLVRIGAAFCGLTESSKMPKLKRVIGLTSHLIQIKEIEEEGFVGYGATCKVAPKMKIGIIPMGYSDGLFHSASNKGYCYIGNIKVPIVGRISMDSLMLDVTNVPEKILYLGAEVEIIGDNVGIEDIAKYTSTINYEVLLAITQKPNKIYI